MNLETIKRGGILAASFLIATLTLVIIQAQPANALLGGLLGGGDRGQTPQTTQPQTTQSTGLLAPLDRTVNGLLDRETGLVPALTDTVTGVTGKILPRTTDTLDKAVITPVKDKVLPGVEKTVDGVTDTVDRVTNPVTRPVNDVVPNVTRPVDNIVSRLSDTLRSGGNTPNNPSTDSPGGNNGEGSPADKANVPSDSSSAAVAGAKDSKIENVDSQPFLASVGSFFTSTLPGTLQDLASTIAGKEVGVLPIAVSILLFLVMLGSIVVIVYASNHGGVLALGSLGTINLSRFMRSHDLTQIASFAIVITGLGVISIYLTLTVL